MSVDELELIGQAKKGHKDSIEDLIRLYYRRVYGSAFLSAKNREDAKDICQEVFYRMWHYINKYDTDRPFSAWIYSITKNVVRRYMNRKKSHLTIQHEDLEDLISISGLDMAACDKLTLLNALESLDESDREILSARFFEGLSVRETAEQLELTESNVKVRLYRAKEKLKEIIEGSSHEGK
jgi:RNA polymerase sigma factor (sigma-70 family)